MRRGGERIGDGSLLARCWPQAGDYVETAGCERRVGRTSFAELPRAKGRAPRAFLPLGKVAKAAPIRYNQHTHTHAITTTSPFPSVIPSSRSRRVSLLVSVCFSSSIHSPTRPPPTPPGSAAATPRLPRRTPPLNFARAGQIPTNSPEQHPLNTHATLDIIALATPFRRPTTYTAPTATATSTAHRYRRLTCDV